MSSHPTRSTIGGSAYLDLQNLARRSGRNTEELFRLYALEGVLARLAASAYASKLVLKGGVLLAAYQTRRPTRDIDLQARQIEADLGAMLEIVREAAAFTIDDGLRFHADLATANSIREENDYQGVRVELSGELATARIRLHVDVNVGDPIWPAPRMITLPGLLGRDVTLLGYPLSMVFAEKIVTALDRGPANSRWRDFADIYLLSGQHPADGTEICGSIRRVATFRGVSLRPLTEVLHGWASTAQPNWTAWRRKQALAQEVPEDFAAVVDCVLRFADPALTGEAAEGTWEPLPRAWCIE
jgi:hypothetical protein